MTDHKPCDPADPCATAYDLASERNTLDGLWAETKDRLDAALAQVARLREALVEVCGCFEAARVEGLDRCLGEEDFYAPGSLVDLVSRRLMVADQAARTALAETADAPAPPPASDGWIAWEGGECPVSTETLVDVRWERRLAAGCCRWDHRETSDDIVAYRIVGARDE